MPIIACGGFNCVSAFQDKTYGMNMRVGNPVKTTARELETLRCTVCKREVTRTRKTPLPDDKGKGKDAKGDKTEAKADSATTKSDKPVTEKKKK